MPEKKQPHPRLDVREYVGRWAAVHPKTLKVVADGASLKEARRAAIDLGLERPLLMIVPESDAYFVGAG